jgi:release factor glutamine methyltransferase
MKIGEAELWLRQELEVMYDKSEATNIASLVMENITQLNKSDRLVKKEQPLNVHQLHHLTEIHHRLLHNEPVQYALGESHFFGLKLFVDKHVLIPRPETEELVDWIIKDVKSSGKDVFKRGQYEADETTQLKILDVGTGSGCIALALKNAIPMAEVWGCDVSDEALAVARRNGAELDIRVDFVGVDFLTEDQRRQLPTADIIVSNPPYIPLRDKDTMHPNVIDYEPHKALFVPNDEALIFYQALASFGKQRLYANGNIYAEIHENLAQKVADLLEKENYHVELRKDMQGKSRMIKARTLSPSDFPR